MQADTIHEQCMGSSWGVHGKFMFFVTPINVSKKEKYMERPWKVHVFVVMI